MMTLIELVHEKALRPGLLGLAGKSVEMSARRNLAGYFKNLAADIEKLDLAALSEQPVLLAKHAVEIKLNHTLRRHSAALQTILETELAHAYTVGYKTAQVQEADEQKQTPFGLTIDKLGESGKAAADYAAEQAGKLVVGINSTTLEKIQGVIEQGITEQLGVPGTGRLLRSLLNDMSVDRAEMIASTEMNDAFSAATLRKLQDNDVGWVRWILSDDACPICMENEDEVVPLGDLFASGDARPPVHPNCRCAIVGARAPE